MIRSAAPGRRAVVLVALLAAACSGDADAPMQGDGPAPAAAQSDAAPDGAAMTEPRPPAAPPPAPSPPPVAALPPPPPPPAPPPRPSIDPAMLIGLDRHALTGLLGSPVFRRADAAAELWRYRAGRCILDLYLYPHGGAPGQPPSVEHVEARQRDGSPAPTSDCLDAVLEARNRAKSG